MDIPCLVYSWESNCNRHIQIALFPLSIPSMVKFAPRLLFLFYLYLVLWWKRISWCVCMTVPAQTQGFGSGGRGDRASVKWKIRLSLQLIVHLCQCCNENPLSKNNFCIRLLGYTSLVCTCLRQQCPSVASYLLTKMGLTSRKLCRLNFPFSLLNKNFFFFFFPMTAEIKKYQHWALSGTSWYP